MPLRIGRAFCRRRPIRPATQELGQVTDPMLLGHILADWYLALRSDRAKIHG
jgi:hypothetical protein